MEITPQEAQEQYKTAETAAKDVERAFPANQRLKLYRSAMGEGEVPVLEERHGIRTPVRYRPCDCVAAE